MNPYKKPEFLHLVVALELVLLAAFLFCLTPVGRSLQTVAPAEQEEQKKYIKWVDFTVTKDAMYKAFRYDVDTCQKELHLNWIQLLAYLGGKYGGDFSKYRASDMETLVSELQDGQTMEELTGYVEHIVFRNAENGYAGKRQQNVYHKNQIGKTAVLFSSYHFLFPEYAVYPAPFP